MFRVLLAVFLAFVLPAVVYILWRTFAPTRIGGSEEIHRGDWERMPWLSLAMAGVVILAVMLVYLALDLDTAPPSRSPSAAPAAGGVPAPAGDN